MYLFRRKNVEPGLKIERIDEVNRHLILSPVGLLSFFFEMALPLLALLHPCNTAMSWVVHVVPSPKSPCLEGGWR